MTSKLQDFIHRWEFQVYDPFKSLDSAYDIEVAGKEIFAGTVKGEVTGVGEDATTVVTETMFVGADDVAVTGVDVRIYDGVSGDPGM